MPEWIEPESKPRNFKQVAGDHFAAPVALDDVTAFEAEPRHETQKGMGVKGSGTLTK